MDDSALFVVRVWRGAAFRASVRRVDDEDTRLFDVPEELVRYLAEAFAARDAATPPPAVDPD